MSPFHRLACHLSNLSRAVFPTACPLAWCSPGEAFYAISMPLLVLGATIGMRNAPRRTPPSRHWRAEHCRVVDAIDKVHARHHGRNACDVRPAQSPRLTEEMRSSFLPDARSRCASSSAVKEPTARRRPLAHLVNRRQGALQPELHVGSRRPRGKARVGTTYPLARASGSARLRKRRRVDGVAHRDAGGLGPNLGSALSG